jgi:mRNA interferase RelE/StbE
MGSFLIEWRKSTKKDLRRIAATEVNKIVAAVTDLAKDPRPDGCTKMQGSDLAYRIRIGDYRVIYEIFEKRLVIEVVRVSHRREVYRKK